MPAVARRKFHDRITGGNSAVELSDRSTARALIQPGFRLLRGSSDSLRRLLGGANAISQHLSADGRYGVCFRRLSPVRGRGTLRASSGHEEPQKIKEMAQRSPVHSLVTQSNTIRTTVSAA